MRTCDAAVLVLRETDNPAVMWGDEGLLHMIAERAGLGAYSEKTRTGRLRRGWETSNAVLANLSKQPGELIPALTVVGSNRRVRIFYLPEHAPAHLRD